VFFVYDLLLSVVVWTILVPWHVVSAVLGRTRWSDLRERLGRGNAAFEPRRSAVAGSSATSQQKKRVVVHAVSAGEVVAAGALIGELLKRGARVIVTVGNEAGRDAAERLRCRFPSIEGVSFLPWDRRRAVRRWLRETDPDSVALVENEIWPNLFRACGEAGVRLLVVNGRIVPRDVARYRLASAFFRRVLRWADRIDAQDEVERARFIDIGADPHRVAVSGNLKVDAARGMLAASVAPEPRDRMIVAGSTHAPEERILLDAFETLRGEVAGLRLVIVPRDVLRVVPLLAEARRRGLHAEGGAAINGAEVTFIDRVGILPRLYGRAAVAFVGGTLAPRGGHNFLEAVAAGTPVILGPHLEHVQAAVASFHGCVAVVRDAGELRAECRRLLLDESARVARASEAARVLERLPLCAKVCAESVLGRQHEAIAEWNAGVA
jgi:3-deoxy-D-manno-octulosonic-acid transferase